jgi:hypothetical protein
MEYQGRRRGCHVDKMEVGKKRSLHSPAVGIQLQGEKAAWKLSDATHDYSSVYGWTQDSQKK